MQETSEAVTATRAPLLLASIHAFVIVLIVSGSSNRYPSTTSMFVLETALAKEVSKLTVEDVPWQQQNTEILAFQVFNCIPLRIPHFFHQIKYSSMTTLDYSNLDCSIYYITNQEKQFQSEVENKPNACHDFQNGSST